MDIKAQILAAIKTAYSPSESRDLDRIIRDNDALCEHLAASLSESEGEVLISLCPVIADRKGRIGWLQRFLESPISSCGLLVATNQRLIYAGIIRRPSVYPWGGVSNWKQAPDNQQFSFKRIQTAKVTESKAGLSFDVQSIDAERMLTSAETGFANQLRGLADYVNQRIAG
jgi:hypothetical protein